MDSAIEKLIELAKENGSKKKTVTVVTVITLAIVGADPRLIAGLAAFFVVLQAILDYFNPNNKEKKDG